MTRFSSLLIAVLLAAVPEARSQECFENVLLPVRANQVPGANGSSWQTFLTITNHGASAAEIGRIGICRVEPCEVSVLRPGATVTPRAYEDYVAIECGDVEQVEISLRVRDLSRTHQTWGTTIPIVLGDDAFYGEVVSITDIPSSPEFRSMLRVYGVPEGSRGEATVRIFEVGAAEETDDALGNRLLADFQVGLSPAPLDPFHTPGLAQIPLWTLPELQGVERVRVEVRASADLGLWAMVSATNNDTQHVTILSPRQSLRD